MLGKNNWIIHFAQVKAYADLLRNELADRLVKGAATASAVKEYYDKIPKSAILNDLRDESLGKWQRVWTQTSKAKVTKEFFS